MINNNSIIDLSSKRVLVTGGAGFLGQSVVETLQARNTKDIFVPRKWEYDLTLQQDVTRLYKASKPDVVIHLAAEVGGIGANLENPGRYFYSNMAMALNMIEEARQSRIEKFVQIGTICAYPKFTPVPFREEDIWNGYPEETNAPYGIAKKAAMVMLDGYYRQYGMSSSYVLPVNLYGPRDNFNLRTSHVIPALIRKFSEGMHLGFPSVTCWGTGGVSREFLYVSDAAEGIVRAAERVSDPMPINLGANTEISISDLASLVARITGYHGKIIWDSSKPDGQPRRCVDASRAKTMLNWAAQTSLEDGIKKTVDWYFANH